MVGNCCILSYYVSLIALTLYYMIKSFSAELPWSRCRSNWIEPCIDSVSTVPSNVSSFAASSSELYFTLVKQFSFAKCKNNFFKMIFRKEVIKQKDHIDDGIGAPDLELTLWLLLAWVCVFLVIVKGIKSSGKASYVLALFPYVVMLTILIHTCTLEGSGDGILYFIKPDFKRIFEAKVILFFAKLCLMIRNDFLRCGRRR